MIVLDTNVVSEPLRPVPAPEVLAWLDRQPAETLFLTTISLAELRYGVEALPAGKRQAALRASVEDQIAALFTGRFLPFDQAAASCYATVRSRAKASGVAIAAADSYIAAIAAAHGFAVATRDETPFRAAGVEVVNPWNSPD